jgi:hypothetical protein
MSLGRPCGKWEQVQVQVTGMNRRSLRLEYFAGLALLAALLPAAGIHAQDAAAQVVPTQTTLSVTQAANGTSTATIRVIGANGLPASGVVSLEEGNRVLGQEQLNGEGEATASVRLPAGAHTLQASYAGDAGHQASLSDAALLHTETPTASTPGFQLSVAAVTPPTLPMTLTAGQTGSVTVTLIPVNNTALTSPMFVTLSCSGLPSQAFCSFTPTNLEILPSTPASCPTGSPASACPPTSTMVISTQSQAARGTPTAQAAPPAAPGRHIAWALLLPGVLGLGGIAWGTRRRRWLQRLSLMAMVGVVTTLSMSACSNPLWYYYNHGPYMAPATPAGTYTVTVTGQTSTGVSAISSSTTLVLTVK